MKTTMSVGCTTADLLVNAKKLELIEWLRHHGSIALKATRISSSSLEWFLGPSHPMLAGNYSVWVRPATPCRGEVSIRLRPLDRVILDHKERPLGTFASIALMAKLVAARHKLPSLLAHEESFEVVAKDPSL